MRTSFDKQAILVRLSNEKAGVDPRLLQTVLCQHRDEVFPPSPRRLAQPVERLSKSHNLALKAWMVLSSFWRSAVNDFIGNQQSVQERPFHVRDEKWLVVLHRSTQDDQHHNGLHDRQKQFAMDVFFVIRYD